MNEPTLKIHRQGTVTVRMDIGVFASIVSDAAKEDSRSNTPVLQELLIKFAEELTHYYSVHNPDAAETELAYDVKKAYSKDNC